MKTLRANFSERSYDLHYGRRLLSIDSLLSIPSSNSKVLVVSNDKLKELYQDLLNEAFSKYTLSWVTISDGEKYKNLDTVTDLYREFSLNKIDKGSVVVAFGGGVLQDIVTYACATFRRGTKFIQIPTTVLSQADIGVGGCAVDTEFGKSLIGTFYQPILAINDLDFLKSLPKEHHINGYAEIICKVVCLGGEYEGLSKDISRLYEEQDLLEKYISLSAKYKKETIERDEIGTRGTRIMLDYGHTVTYALETLTGYTMLHGYALGIGMNIAGCLSFIKGFLTQENAKQLRDLIDDADLPTILPPEIDVEQLIDQMSFDQKTVNGEIRFILLKDFGEPFLSGPVNRKEIKQAIQLSEDLK